MKEKNYIINLKAFGSLKSGESVLSGNPLVPALKELQNVIKDYPASIKIEDKSINKRLDTFARSYLNNVKGRMRNNPPNWDRLSPVTKRLRRYRLDPNELKKDIINATARKVNQKGQEKHTLFGGNNPKNVRGALNYEQIVDAIEMVIFSLPRLSIHTLMSPYSPMLIQSGDLMDSINVKYISNRRKTQKGQTFTRGFHYYSNVSYANKVMNGGLTEVYSLAITKYEYSPVWFPIYKEWIPFFRKLDLGPMYTVEIEAHIVDLPRRNPFDMKEEDVKDLNKVIDFTDQYFRSPTANYNKLILEKIDNSI